MNVEVVLDAQATIGEAPTWVAEEEAIYWIDIKQPALHRFDLRSRTQRSWMMSSEIGAFALLPEHSGALCALREGIYKLDFASNALERLVAPPFDPSLFRFNEGACDANGRFWVGVMFDPVEARAKARRSSLHSFTLRDGLRLEPDSAELHNGMAWSPDGKTFYLSHSRQREVFAFAYDEHGGELHGRRLFVRISDTLGVPDGAAVDTDGGYWCALHGSGRLHRYSATGVLDTEILLPVSQPTMCTFGGVDLDTLFTTSARDKLTAEELERQPLAGALLSIRPGKKGAPRRCSVR